jgi:hypothetical protein
VHGGLVWLAGQVADDTSLDVEGQTADILRQIDALLAEAGTDKSRLLSVQIFITDITKTAETNRAWDRLDATPVVRSPPAPPSRPEAGRSRLAARNHRRRRAAGDPQRQPPLRAGGPPDRPRRPAGSPSAPRRSAEPVGTGEAPPGDARSLDRSGDARLDQREPRLRAAGAARRDHARLRHRPRARQRRPGLRPW